MVNAFLLGLNCSGCLVILFLSFLRFTRGDFGLCSGLVVSPSLEEQSPTRQRFSKCSTAAKEPVQACIVAGSNRGSSQDGNGREAPERVRGPDSGRGIRSSLPSPGTSFAPRSTYLSLSLSDSKSKEGSSRNESSIADAFVDKNKNPRTSDRQLKEDRGAWPKSVPYLPAVSVCSTRSSTTEEHGFRREGVRGDRKGDLIDSWIGAGRRDFYLSGNSVGSMEEPRAHWHSRLSPSTMGVVSTASTVSSGAEEPDFEVLKRGPSIRNRSVMSPLKWTRGGREKLQEDRSPHRTGTASGPGRGRITSFGITSVQSEDGPDENESGEKVKKGLLGKVAVNFVRRDQKHQHVSSEPLPLAAEIMANSEPAPESPLSEGEKNARVDPPTIQGQRVFCLPPSAWAVETASDAYRKELRIRAAIEREKQKNWEDEEARAYVRSVVFNPDEEAQQWREEVQDRLDTFRPENRPFSTFSTPVPANSPPVSDHGESPRGDYLCPEPQDPPGGRNPSNTPSSDEEQRGSGPKKKLEGDGVGESIRSPRDKKCLGDATGSQGKTRRRRAAARPRSRFGHESRTERSQCECLRQE